ncbi:MAG TPA: DUF433 domain-containing protein [Methylomirabilota bacterium]|nr:DUF433 domain-containing protein [Methylomirabilota bacterium]
MTDMPTTQTIPLTRDEDGVWRVSGSRVTLDTIVHQFKSGATAEQIQEDFPSLALGDIYSVIAHYLEHSRAVEEYLGEQAMAAEAIRREVESRLDSAELRERFRRRRAQAVA